jgi:TolB protein
LNYLFPNWFFLKRHWTSHHELAAIECLLLRELIMLFINRIIVVVLCVFVFTIHGSSRQTGHERIVYVSFQPGNWDIYFFKGRGTLPERLTDSYALDYDVALSTDGRWAVFTSDREGSPHLYVLDLKNRKQPRLLIRSEAMEDQATLSPDGKFIAFVSTRDGNADIFLLPFRPSRTQMIGQAINLTHNPGGDFRPAFSPDGQHIAFSSDRDTPPTGDPANRRREGEIYVMDSDGKNLRRLTYSPGWDGSPTWSRDGKTIYFYSARDKHCRIWAMTADGNSPHPISSTDEVALSPAVMPDGRIAFAARTGKGLNPHWKIMSVNPEGTDERLESDTSNDYWKPVFDQITGAMLCHGTGPMQNGIPAGPKLPDRVYLGEGPLLVNGFPRLATLPDRKVDLYAVRGFSVAPHPFKDLMVRTDLPDLHLTVSDLHGENSREIVKISGTDVPWIGLTWSRDGKQIAYGVGEMFSPPNAEADIWKISPDGSGAVNLTPNSPGNDGFPSFSGDGRRMVFRSGRTGNFDIYIMNSDGTNVRNLTNHPADDTFPAFSPLNDEIAFSSNRDGELDSKTGNRTFEIYTLKVSPDGSPGALRRITYTHGQNAHPQYSPDGQWLVFTSEQGGISDEEPLINTVIFSPQPYGELYICRLKDGKIFRLTNNKWEDGFPYWVSPSHTDNGLERARHHST